MKKNLLLLSFIVIIISIFCNFQAVIFNIKNSIYLFEQKVFPSLFPIMVISPFLINYGFLNISNFFLGPIMRKVFNTSKNSSYIFAMSIISGFPSSAIYAKELYTKNLISKEEIEKLILFSHFANPFFVLTMVSTKPMLVLFSHYMVNFIIGFCNKNCKIADTYNKEIPIPQKEFFKVLVSSIKNCIETSLFILGIIIFFSMIIAIFNHPILNIILELSQGLESLSTYNDNWLKGAITASLLSFGGISVHVQVMGTLSDIGIKYFPYMKTRLIHALLSFIIVFLLWTVW